MFVRPARVLAHVALATALALVSVGASLASAETYPYCAPGEAPLFRLGFSALKAHLGQTMGEPLECERADAVTGDTSQQTSTGYATYRRGSGLVVFAAADRKWALVDDRVVHWKGPELTPPTAVPSWLAVPSALAAASRTPSTVRPVYPLNGRFLLLNMHGLLFHEDPRDFAENVAYARWMRAGVIRTFATDNNTLKPWSGLRLGNQIADMAPVLRAGDVKLIVALVNNHRPVPGEAPQSFGWLWDYDQLLLPFYTHTWRGAYASFMRELIGTVKARGALDVIHAWELGNELHTPENAVTVLQFVKDAVAEVRRVDPTTPIYPGTMGANHLQPWNERSPVARWLYCEAPVDAYTLHAYDWVSRQRQGDMPIEWDLDWITAEPCPSGRRLPVIVEELGTSRALRGMYERDEEAKRLALEISQLRFVLGFPQVKGVGVWNGESPRVVDRTFYDYRRGLTSWGPGALGGGSCYDPRPDPAPGLRCQLERILQQLPTPP